MYAEKKYVVYTLNKLLGSQENLVLEEMCLKDWTDNLFDSEADAIHALIDDERTYGDYIILPKIFIRN